MAKKSEENKELLAIQNANKTVIAEVANVLSVNDLRNKHSWIIYNINIDIARNQELIGIKKY